MRIELLEKIYRQIIACETEIDKIDKNNNYPNSKEGQYQHGKDIGKKEELGENIIFCYELISILLGNE